MRLGAVLTDPLLRDVELVQRLGFDLAWIDAGGAAAPLVAAAGAATVAPSVRLVVRVEAGAHPLTLAEECAVADLASGGRLTLTVAGADVALLEETVDVLQQALAARPFSHDGVHWRIPAGLPEHSDVEARIRVTPSPAQLELPIWVCGPAGPAVARSRMLPYVAVDDERAESPAGHWDATAATLGAACLRIRRPGVIDVVADGDGAFDRAALLRRLVGERAAWGMDVAVLRLPAGLRAQARCAALTRIAREVRPRLILDGLPQGLEQHWDAPDELHAEWTRDRGDR